MGCDGALTTIKATQHPIDAVMQCLQGPGRASEEAPARHPTLRQPPGFPKKQVLGLVSSFAVWVGAKCGGHCAKHEDRSTDQRHRLGHTPAVVTTTDDEAAPER
jgi:hypothetical protein